MEKDVEEIYNMCLQILDSVTGLFNDEPLNKKVTRGNKIKGYKDKEKP